MWKGAKATLGQAKPLAKMARQETLIVGDNQKQIEPTAPPTTAPSPAEAATMSTETVTATVPTPTAEGAPQDVPMSLHSIHDYIEGLGRQMGTLGVKSAETVRFIAHKSVQLACGNNPDKVYLCAENGRGNWWVKVTNGSGAGKRSQQRKAKVVKDVVNIST